MSYTKVLTAVPVKITAGDSISWKKTYSDFPATAWDLSYSLLNSGNNISIAAAASDDDHVVELTAIVTGKYEPGAYAWQAYATHKTNGERYKVAEGSIEILANFATATSKKIDTRSHAKKVLDALEALIEGKASKDQAAYSIAGRSISRLSPGELIEWRNYYLNEYRKERRTEKRQQGKRTGSKVKTRFV